MGFMSDTARKGFGKANRRVYVPESMQMAQWVALALIPLILLIAVLRPDSTTPVDAAGEVSQIASPVGTTVQSGSNDTGSEQIAGAVTLPKAGGGSVSVPKAALDVAKSAGLALWTGQWDGVAVEGNPSNDASFPDAELGRAVVFSSQDTAVTFSIQLDSDGNGSFDQSFQISVVTSNGRWVYPSSGN